MWEREGDGEEGVSGQVEMLKGKVLLFCDLQIRCMLGSALCTRGSVEVCRGPRLWIGKGQ